MTKQIIAYAGITEGKLDYGWLESDGYQDGLYGIFRTKKEAKRRYEQVVPVIITFNIQHLP